MFILDRSLISLSGVQNKSFLQGMITSDINKVTKGVAIYAVMLSPQGRFLYDFFIIEEEGKLLIDCASYRCEEIIKKLSFYKLRAEVNIAKMADYSVIAFFDENFKERNSLISFPDPRHVGMGYRAFATSKQLQELKENYPLQPFILYEARRIDLKIADDSDLAYDQSLVLEYDFERLNAIDYQKGCYVGQEVVARSHYRGLVRKKIFLIEVTDITKLDRGSEITCLGKKQGIILSSATYSNNSLRALALLRYIDNEGQEIDLTKLDLMVKDRLIKLIN